MNRDNSSFTESSAQQNMLEKLIEMMMTMEKNRLASEEKFMKLLERKT